MSSQIKPNPGGQASNLVPLKPRNRQESGDLLPSLASECSVVIVSYKPGPVILECLKSVLRQPEAVEIFVIDNGTDRRLNEQIHSLGDKRISIVSGQGNVGFAKGCNLGVARSTSPYVLLLNPDCILPDHALQESLAVFKSHEDASLVSVCLENPDGTEQRGGRRNLMTPWTGIVEQFQLYRFAPEHPYFQRLNLDGTEPLSEITQIECTSGAFMLMAKTTYDEIGGMDEDYFLHVEDIDFCMRLAKAGRAIYFAPDIRILHLKSTSRSFPAKIEWHKTISAMRYFRKHFQPAYPQFILRIFSFALFLRFLGKCVPMTFKWIFSPRREALDRMQREEIENAVHGGAGSPGDALDNVPETSKDTS